MGNQPESMVDPNGLRQEPFTHSSGVAADNMSPEEHAAWDRIGQLSRKGFEDKEGFFASIGMVGDLGGPGGAEEFGFAVERQSASQYGKVLLNLFGLLNPSGQGNPNVKDAGVNGLTEVPIINYRFHFVFEEFTPEIYEFTVDMLRINPKLSVLTYNGGGEHAVKNRNLALKNYKKTPAGTNRSWDEFPYAITEEGGLGANVRSVSVCEQNIQRTQLSVLVRLGSRMKKGDKIIVVPIPKTNSKQPVPFPTPREQPWLFPIFNIPKILVPRLVPVVLPLYIPDGTIPENNFGEL